MINSVPVDLVTVNEDTVALYDMLAEDVLLVGHGDEYIEGNEYLDTFLEQFDILIAGEDFKRATGKSKEFCIIQRKRDDRIFGFEYDAKAFIEDKSFPKSNGDEYGFTWTPPADYDGNLGNAPQVLVFTSAEVFGPKSEPMFAVFDF